MATRSTHRWWIGAFVALMGVTMGVLTGVAAPVAVGVIGVVYAGYARNATAPSPVLQVDRNLGDPEPLPGEAVRVTLTIDNRGGPVLDLRIIDSVPEALEVIDGSPGSPPPSCRVNRRASSIPSAPSAASTASTP